MSTRQWRSGALALVAVLVVPAAASAAITTQDRTQGADVLQMAQELAGSGVTITSATHTGHETAAGLFQGGTDAIGFEQGVLLGSGAVANVIGPNDDAGKTSEFNNPGDPLLDQLGGGQTFDASVLDIVFVPVKPTAKFRYVFGSEEYNEFVNEGFNDVFGFFVNGQNCALVPGTQDPVAIDSVNTTSNAAYFRDNEDGHLDTQLDGLTTVLTCEAAVNPGQENTLRLAIADRGDFALDSDVFLEANSFVSGPAKTVLRARSAVADVVPGAKAYLFTLSATLTEEGAGPVPGKTVSFASGSTPLCSATTDAQGVASCSAVSKFLTTTLALGYDASFAGDDAFQAAAAHAPLVKAGSLAVR